MRGKEPALRLLRVPPCGHTFMASAALQQALFSLPPLLQRWLAPEVMQASSCLQSASMCAAAVLASPDSKLTHTAGSQPSPLRSYACKTCPDPPASPLMPALRERMPASRPMSTRLGALDARADCWFLRRLLHYLPHPASCAACLIRLSVIHPAPPGLCCGRCSPYSCPTPAAHRGHGRHVHAAVADSLHGASLVWPAATALRSHTAISESLQDSPSP